MSSPIIEVTEEALNALISRQEIVLNRLNKLQETFMDQYNTIALIADTIFDHISILTEKISDLEALQRSRAIRYNNNNFAHQTPEGTNPVINIPLLMSNTNF